MRKPDIQDLDGLRHKCWTLSAVEDRTFDCCRMEYEAVSDAGERRLIDWSPFQQYDPRHFIAMVDHDFPRRTGAAALFPEDIDALKSAA